MAQLLTDRTPMVSMTDDGPVGWDEVVRARERLRPILNPTPLQVSRTLGARCGADVWLKPESLQRTGSFKIRGAYNKVASLSREEQQKGVITYSSGNHGQAMACAATLLGLKSVVVMPEDAMVVKVDAAKGYGADVCFAGFDSLDRQARALELQRQFGYTVVPPFDDPQIIAGQATCGWEIAEEIPDLDVVLVPCGGGGLISGISLAIKRLLPGVKVVGVEPEGGDDARLSLAAGEIVEKESQTICDGLRTKRIGGLNFQTMRRYVDEIVTVSDAYALAAVRFLALRARLVVEPSGAVGVAALLSGAVRAPGLKIAVVLSGGNIEPARLVQALAQPDG